MQIRFEDMQRQRDIENETISDLTNKLRRRVSASADKDKGTEILRLRQDNRGFRDTLATGDDARKILVNIPKPHLEFAARDVCGVVI